MVRGPRGEHSDRLAGQRVEPFSIIAAFHPSMVERRSFDEAQGTTPAARAAAKAGAVVSAVGVTSKGSAALPLRAHE